MRASQPETFSPDWLALREPADHRARAADLLPPLRAAWRTAGWRRILDLGSGAGSNLRYLAPRLPGPQAWTLLDHDADLLARAAAADPAHRVTRLRGDLAREGVAAVADAHLVTCSALLDLVSAGWLGSLARACRAASCGVLLALSYDGTMRWLPAPGEESAGGPAADDADDRLLQRLVNAHQRRDRQPAPALGPDAAQAAAALLAAAGYRTTLRPSPWRLGPADAALAGELVAGWERAALEIASGPAQARRVRAWAARRRGTIAAGSFRLVVGHQDLLALPAAGGETPRRTESGEAPG